MEGSITTVFDIATGDVLQSSTTGQLYRRAWRCESWASWGILESIAGEDWLLFLEVGGALVRQRIADGAREVVAQLQDAGDICSLALDTSRGRLLFHTEFDAQFTPQVGEEFVATCPASTCLDGTCTCAGGARFCGGSCQSPGVVHCGGCGDSCDVGESCTDGACVCAGELCADGCADLRSDPRHCGSCPTACSFGQECLASACVDPVDLVIAALGTNGCDHLELRPMVGAPAGSASVRESREGG